MNNYNGTAKLSEAALAAAVKQLPPGGWLTEEKPNGGVVIHYNPEDPAWKLDSPGVQPAPERTGEPVQLVIEAAPGTFADRVISHKVHLIKLIDQGLPALDFLPASDEMLVRGKRHAVAAPAKTGKSLAWLSHAVDMVLAGAVVVVFDRENGATTYAMRLRDIMNARRLAPIVR